MREIERKFIFWRGEKGSLTWKIKEKKGRNGPGVASERENVQSAVARSFIK